MSTTEREIDIIKQALIVALSSAKADEEWDYDGLSLNLYADKEGGEIAEVEAKFNADLGMTVWTRSTAEVQNIIEWISDNKGALNCLCLNIAWTFKNEGFVEVRKGTMWRDLAGACRSII